jgi:hypothetical protein
MLRKGTERHRFIARIRGNFGKLLFVPLHSTVEAATDLLEPKLNSLEKFQFSLHSSQLRPIFHTVSSFVFNGAVTIALVKRNIKMQMSIK